MFMTRNTPLYQKLEPGDDIALFGWKVCKAKKLLSLMAELGYPVDVTDDEKIQHDAKIFNNDMSALMERARKTVLRENDAKQKSSLKDVSAELKHLQSSVLLAQTRVSQKNHEKQVRSDPSEKNGEVSQTETNEKQGRRETNRDELQVGGGGAGDASDVKGRGDVQPIVDLEMQKEVARLTNEFEKLKLSLVERRAAPAFKSVADEIEKLAAQKDRGLLSEEEFQQAKATVLA